MKAGIVVIHYPQPDLVEDFVSRVEKVVEVFESAPGYLQSDIWLSEGKVIFTGQWESEEAMGAGIAAVDAAGLDTQYDEREIKPPEEYMLTLA